MDFLTDYLDKFECQPDARDALLEAFLLLKRNDAAVATLDFHVNEYKLGRLDWKRLTEDAESHGRASGIHEYTARFIFYTALVPHSYHYFEEKGLGYTEWYDSMIDLRWKLEECAKVYGIWGVFTDWFKAFFTAERVAFGRLQFNLYVTPSGYVSDSFNVKEGDTVVAVHIPTDTRTPFTRENREAAYARAARHFSKILGVSEVIFRCGTWLLHPAHREILPEGSNVRDFLDDFELVPDSFVETDGNIWRLFYTKNYNGDPSTLPSDTSMMRIYKKFMLDGGKIGTMVGFRKETV